MARFGRRSKARLATIDPRLREVMYDVIDHYDFTIVCGHRNEEDQTEAYATGASKVQWPNSKHNSHPSIAVDVAPWPIDWKDSLAFARLAGRIEQAAAARGLRLRWGGDWDRDGGSRDQSFMDIGHLEIIS